MHLGGLLCGLLYFNVSRLSSRAGSISRSSRFLLYSWNPAARDACASLALRSDLATGYRLGRTRYSSLKPQFHHLIDALIACLYFNTLGI
ncbi:hypothetical protein EJ04DRAFT_168923 [Polyplosphaeria fusca]|uniref:Uncharacterized protein n=1 Tax=Polyplosphaeria fusca TaxID=682080 RepID=A0A9P4V7G5_9PLEO|nr:hypothetical protein EJ04DRAFT_168923 [Polyplosphaeria fusca]